MNFIIFGGEGFIGHHLVNYLDKNIDAGSRIYSVDLVKRHELDSCKTFVNGDVRKYIALNISNSQSSIIYNLAAVHKTPGHNDCEYYETNISGAINICQFARENNIDTIIFTSSIAPYGASEELKQENSIPMPNTPYGISKLVAEYIHKVWQAEKPHNRKLIIVRPGVVFGEAEEGNFTRLYKSIKRGYFFYPGRKNTLKASVYVKDVARILYETSLNEKPGVSIFNLTYYPVPTIKHICDSISRVMQLKSPKILVPGRLLKVAATGIYYTGYFMGKKFDGVHPDRVKKLMLSTNISGEKLAHSRYALKFSLEEAIRDWYNDCHGEGLN
jgi:nucleoside-diphosphate-sugar epimerase